MGCPSGQVSGILSIRRRKQQADAPIARKNDITGALFCQNPAREPSMVDRDENRVDLKRVNERNLQEEKSNALFPQTQRLYLPARSPYMRGCGRCAA
jgi:hypothetical protein